MIEINNIVNYKFCRRKTKRLFVAFLHIFKLPEAEVSLALISSSKMKELNNNYRGINKTTDVLSFPVKNKQDLKFLKKEKFWGEIFIDPLEISDLKKYDEMFQELGLKLSYSKTRQAYLFYFLLAHGLLHLAGFKDEKNKDRLEMLKIGKELLDLAKIK